MTFFVKGDNGVMLECDPITINDGDTLRVTISNEYNLDESCEAYEQICKLFPKNKIVGLFSGMTLVKEQEEVDG